MSAINEAYARIDFATIQELQNRMDALENKIPSGPLSILRGDGISIDDTIIFATTINIPGDHADNIKVSFGNSTFKSWPVVTGTLYDPYNANEDVELPNLVMRNMSKNSVVFNIQRKAKRRYILHVVAIGEVP